MWEDLINKAKEGGLDVIETYVFWNVHEPSPGNVLLSIFLQNEWLNFRHFFAQFGLTLCVFVNAIVGFSIILKGDMIW